MGFVLFSIIFAIIGISLCFLTSVNIGEWFVWGMYLLTSIVFFVMSFVEYNSALKGESKSTRDIIGIAAYPFVTSIMGVILIVLLFVDISKFHLLWIYPFVAMIFEFTIGKRALNKFSEEKEKRQK